MLKAAKEKAAGAFVIESPLLPKGPGKQFFLIFEEFIEEVGVDFLPGNELLDGGGIFVGFFPQPQEAGQHDFQGAGDGLRGGGEDLAHEQHEEVPLAAGEGVVLVPLEKGGNGFVKLVLRLGGRK